MQRISYRQINTAGADNLVSRVLASKSIYPVPAGGVGEISLEVSTGTSLPFNTLYWETVRSDECAISPYQYDGSKLYVFAVLVPFPINVDSVGFGVQVKTNGAGYLGLGLYDYSTLSLLWSYENPAFPYASDPFSIGMGGFRLEAGPVFVAGRFQAPRDVRLSVYGGQPVVFYQLLPGRGTVSTTTLPPVLNRQAIMPTSDPTFWLVFRGGSA